MDVAIIGTGNVATILGKLLRLNGIKINGVIGRNTEATKELAAALNTQPFNHASLCKADVGIIAVADGAIVSVAAEAKDCFSLLLHTAGSISIDILQPYTNNYGVIWPIQSIRKEVAELPPIPFAYEANNVNSLQTIKELLSKIAVQYEMMNFEQRSSLHAAAVITSNFSNYLYVLAERYCQEKNIHFAMLHPLIIETADRLQKISPALVQTGPAVRHDIVTMQHHSQLFKNDQALEQVYKLFSTLIGNDAKLQK